MHFNRATYLTAYFLHPVTHPLCIPAPCHPSSVYFSHPVTHPLCIPTPCHPSSVYSRTLVTHPLYSYTLVTHPLCIPAPCHPSCGFTYSCVDESFRVDAMSGEITVNNNLDREVDPTFELIVAVSSVSLFL